MARTEVRGGQILDASVSLTADVTGTLPVGSGGTGLASSGTVGKVLTSDGSVWSADLPPGGRGSIASGVQALTASSANLITGTSIALVTSALKVGSRFAWDVGLIKTAAGTATWNLLLKFGTANTTADAAIATWTSGTNTAAVDQGRYIIEMEVLTLGASATAKCICISTNSLTNVTGLGRIGFIPTPTATFNSAATSPYLHIDITPGASASFTAVGAAHAL